MPSTYDDQVNGVTTSVAIKPPCVTRTLANITLSGTQTIDGVAVVAGDRVLVVAQTAASENGIWIASATAWARASDFDGARDITKGTLITVLGGSTLGSNIFWRVTTANPIVIGTTNIAISAMPLIAIGSFGTMANQNATAVNIDGGTIDATIIGGATPAAVTGTAFTGNSFAPNNASIPTNGMYLAAANSVAFSSNGVEALSFDATNGIWNAHRGIYANQGALNSPSTSAVYDYAVGPRISDTGTSGINFYTGGVGLLPQFRVVHVASSSRCVSVAGSNGGNPVISTTAGDLDLQSFSGIIKLGSANSFAANGVATVTISALAPAGVTTATIKKWLVIKDSAGTTLYIPAWGA